MFTLTMPEVQRKVAHITKHVAPAMQQRKLEDLRNEVAAILADSLYADGWKQTAQDVESELPVDELEPLVGSLIEHNEPQAEQAQCLLHVQIALEGTW